MPMQQTDAMKTVSIGIIKIEYRTGSKGSSTFTMKLQIRTLRQNSTFKCHDSSSYSAWNAKTTFSSVSKTKTRTSVMHVETSK